MKNLILVRHGKSGYENFTTDKNRQISETGIERTVKVALDSKDFIDKTYAFWSSSAERAAATAAIFSEIIPIEKDLIYFTDDLYTFDIKALQNIIHSIPNEIDKIVVFGHNPAFTDFINDNTNLNIDNVPTSGLVSIEFETDKWKKLPKGTVIKTLFAKDL